MKQIVIKERFDLQSIPHFAVAQQLAAFRVQYQLTRSVMLDDGDTEEFFIAPGAYCVLASSASDVPGVSLSRHDGDSVGTIFGVPCRSPTFIRSEARDYEGLGQYHFEYRIWRHL